MIACAWVGFAPVVVTLQSLRALIQPTPATDLWLFLAGGVAALLLQALARGGFAWIGLRGGQPRLIHVWGAAVGGWGRLLPGAFLDGLLTFLCALCVTPFMISSGLVAVNLVPINPIVDGLPRLVATRSLDAVALGVLHPLGESVDSARIALLPLFLRTERPDPEVWQAFRMVNHMDPSVHHEAPEYVVPMAELPAALIALAGLALLAAAEGLLRFNAAVAISVAPRGVFGSLMLSARLGARHARLVLFNAVALRLLTRGLQVVCLVVTTSVAETMILPRLAGLTGAPWVVPLGVLAGIVTSAAVGALMCAFCDIYDARLYVALRRDE
jgi:hypothetical protein